MFVDPIIRNDLETKMKNMLLRKLKETEIRV